MFKWTCGILMAMLAAVPAAAQPDAHACEAPPELERIYQQEIRNHPQAADSAHERVNADPDNVFLNRWYLEAVDNDPGFAVEEYRARLAVHPDDARYLYFYGRALVGYQTREAIEYLNRAIARDARLPWTYVVLMEIYESPKFSDPLKLGDAMIAFTQLCPDNLSVYSHLHLVENPGTVRVLAGRLRRAIETRTGSGIGEYYSMLWPAELRAADSEHAADVKRQIAADLPRVRELDPQSYHVQAEAYRLTGDTAMAEYTEQKVKDAPKRQTVRQAIDGWLLTHHPPARDAAPEDRVRSEQEVLAASATWVRDWPEEPYAWSKRFEIVARQKETTSDELKQLGDKVVEVAHRHPARWSVNPEVLMVAREWNRRGLRVADCAKLAAEAVVLIQHAPSQESDLWSTPQSDSQYEARVIGSLFDAYDIQTQTAIQLQDYTQTEATIGEMKIWLDRHHTDNLRPFSSFNLAKARLAEAQDHPLDAVGFYQRAIQTGSFDAEVMARTRALFEQNYVSREPFETWLTRPPDPQLWVDWYNPASRWTRLDQPMDAFHAADLTGRMWTAADLKGKATLIAAWATWCEPCLTQLAEVEKLHSLTKDRHDVQVITLNLDEDASKVEPFVRQHGFTFPVIPATEAVKGWAPGVVLPHAWIADASAHLRRETSVFDARIANWAQDVLDQLAAAAGWAAVESTAPGSHL